MTFWSQQLRILLVTLLAGSLLGLIPRITEWMSPDELGRLGQSGWVWPLLIFVNALMLIVGIGALILWGRTVGRWLWHTTMLLPRQPMLVIFADQGAGSFFRWLFHVNAQGRDLDAPH